MMRLISHNWGAYIFLDVYGLSIDCRVWEMIYLATWRCLQADEKNDVFYCTDYLDKIPINYNVILTVA